MNPKGNVAKKRKVIGPALEGDVLQGEHSPGFKIKTFGFGPGVGGFARAAAARGFDPVYQEWGEKSGIVPATQEVKQARLERLDEYHNQVGGQELLERLQEKAKAADAPHAISNEFEGEPLTPEDEKFLRENRADVDRFMRGSENEAGFAKILSEARRRGYSIGDKGPTYYPHRVGTVGEVIRGGLSHVDPENSGTYHTNLEGIRKSDLKIEDDITAARGYLNQLADRETITPFERNLKNLRRTLLDQDRPLEAAHVEAWRQNNVLGRRQAADAYLFQKQMEGIRDEALESGATWKATGKIGEAGKFTVLDEAGKVEAGPDTGEPVYRVNIEPKEGEAYETHLSRTDLLASKYADTLINKSPVTKALWAAHRLTSDLYVWNNLRSAVHHLISGGAKLATVGLDSEALQYGAGEATRWLKGDLTPEETAHLERVGALDKQMRDVTEVEGDKPGWIRKFGYAGLNGPANFYRVWAYNAFEAQLAKSHPDWSPKQVEAMAAVRASQVATIASDAVRSPLSFNPLVKMVMFMQNAGTKDFVKIVSEAQQGRVIRPLAQAGITAGTILALHAAAGRSPSQMAETAMHLLPFSAMFTGEGYQIPMMGAAHNFKEAFRSALDATGLRPDEKADLMRAMPTGIKTFKDLGDLDFFRAFVPGANKGSNKR